MITNLRIQDLEARRRRQALGLMGGILLALALWVALVAAVVVLT